MGQPRPRGSVSDRLAAAAAGALVGRAEERARLTALLAPDGPAAVFVHGPGGIGKTSLVTGTLASLPLRTTWLDGRRTEPTVPGALAALGAALGVPAPPSAAAAADRIADARTDVLVVDAFERLNLLDGWIRNELTSALPASVTTLLVGRRGPNVAWRTAPGWRALLAELVVGPMTAEDVDELLAALGVGGPDAERMVAFARGHPLAAVVAAEALARRPGRPLGSGAPADVVEELFAVMLDDLAPRERATVEAASVLRRVTLPLLTAVVDEPDTEQAWRTLRALPFTTTTSAGVELSGVAAPVLLEALELRDPSRVRELRARAARAVLGHAPHGPDWETTADLLHLVQNPLIRNAYAPPGRLQHPAERVRAEDRDRILAITRRFAGPGSARLAERWWRARRDAFSVVRGGDGDVVAFSATTAVDGCDGLGEDPVVRGVAARLRTDPLPPGAQALLFRWALGCRFGERTTPEVATLVVDLKRTYLELRATLRRVYTAVADWRAAAPVLRVMGFDALEEVVVGERRYVLVCLDFGPGGVDAWIGRHVLSEQATPSPATGGRDGGTAGTPVPGAAAPGGRRPALLTLTAREQEVLALLAEGMTNAELAGTLFISERTANRHVSNIFTKLGVHNRTQAARVAVAAGLSG
ncbi:helix-turn-helix transcriptional regulator [Geodermatophilus sp. YIM 151500]|uniref:helix-turn-helix transcriptional regulator n=1 Tax=Geodermatophilus sp. YIM 151500 TaxID=2984531 RepID=UPI0021E4B729|nr:helix-turn-helix transcriptional regulator [Geodermatophilus sp. YIM 151500]MCV2489316.1 helix-turn-helix transcriptional regulator [Geodermatophilus sp. YIM 151500]